jgi:hypothetical protein
MTKVRKFLSVNKEMFDQIARDTKSSLLDDIKVNNCKIIRFVFDNTSLDAKALSCIDLANRLGYTELAAEMVAEMKESEEGND